MGRKVTKLSDIDIDEVSLVDRGANQHAKVVLHKRLDEEDGVETDEVGETEDEVGKTSPGSADLHVGDGEEPDDENDEFDDEGKPVEKGFFSRLVDKMFGDEDVSKINPGMQIPPGLNPQAMGQPAPGPQGMMPGVAPGMPQMGAPQAFPAGPGQMPGQMQAGPPIPQEVVQYVQQLEQALAQALGEDDDDNSNDEEDDVNPFGKSAEDLSQDEVDFLQSLAKNLDDEDTREAVNKAIELVDQANTRAEEAENIAKAERDYRLTQEYVAKAKSLVNLPVNPEEFGPVLKRLQENMTSEDAEVLEKALSAANESLATAGVFTEIGKTGGFGGDNKVEARAEEIRKADDGITKEQAIAKALEENPDLYDDYLSSNGNGRA